MKCTDASFAVGDPFAPSFKIQASDAAIGSNPKISATIRSDNTDKNAANNKAVTPAIVVGSVVQVNVPKAGTGVGTVMGNFGSSGINCGTTCTVTVKFPLASGGSITLTAKAGLRSKLTTWSGPNCKSRGAQPTCTIKVQSGGTYSIGAIFEQLPSEKVVLLLHGMNSEPATWKDFVKQAKFKECFTIDNSVIIKGIADIKDDKPIITPAKSNELKTNKNAQQTYCYAVRFGTFDASGENGLENAKLWASVNNVRWAGDFSTFDQLGMEVRSAVEAISKVHQGAHILLIGHSRGGLAARAFLNAHDDPNAPAPFESGEWIKWVDGLITTGSPHKGSPIGRLYKFLSKNPRTSCGKGQACKTDWDLVDKLKKSIDARRPVIDYLAIGSDQLNKLNRGTLQPNMLTGQIRYADVLIGCPLGYAVGTLDATIFAKNRGCGLSTVDFYVNKLSERAADTILGIGVNVNTIPNQWTGDGIVPVANQSYLDLTKTKNDWRHPGGAVIHTEEPKEVGDLNQAICNLRAANNSMPFKTWVTCP
jgi:hypothetical protein